MLETWLRWLAALCFSANVLADDISELMTSADLANLEHPEADARIHYGDGAFHFGDLRVPAGAGPHPVILFIHGGCWRAKFGLAYADELMAAFTREGFATWSIEYRRVGDEGGGWPNTFIDVANGADHLVEIAPTHHLDLERVVAMGHSAGGHFALWLAARGNLPAESPVSSQSPLQLQAVLALAPAPDLMHLHEKKVCGHIIDKLMGGSPDDFPARYRWADPVHTAPGTTPQVLFIGKYDEAWAPVGLRYLRTAQARGDDVKMIEATESGHFEMVDPKSTTWPLVLEATIALFARQEK